MQPNTYRNASFATAAALSDLIAAGTVLSIRGQESREIRNRITMLERPSERCLFLPHRGNSIVASLAETFWVLRGRDDVSWLKAYVPRAPDFSDDGVVWRGAYGPRLRNWSKVDQLDAVRRLLLEEPLSRRAVIVLYDPGRDFVSSKDIPCNDWLHWLVRGNRLHLNVAVRSNDVIWGFSGINSFEWSVVQEMLAFWIGMSVGDATYFASSLHVYKHHYSKAAKVVAAFGGVTCYDFGLAPPPFGTPWDEFDQVLGEWFALEGQIRKAPDHGIAEDSSIRDPLMNNALRVLRLHWGLMNGWSVDRLKEGLAALPETDLTAAAYELFGRKHPQLLSDIPQPSVAAFIAAYTRGSETSAQHIELSSIKTAIKLLHRRKDAVYGDSWKRRGEWMGILANIARKADRLGNIVGGSLDPGDETVLDTEVDLLVYVMKYRLFLMERDPTMAAGSLPPSAQRPFSDHPSNFDTLVDALVPTEGTPRLARDLVSALSSTLDQLNREGEAPTSTPAARLGLASLLSGLALELVMLSAREQPAGMRDFVNAERTLAKRS